MKAHIARNQNAGVPLILGWNLSPADRGKLEGMAPAFGMKVLLVSPADAGKTVAQLLGEVETKAARTLVLEPGAYPPAAGDDIRQTAVLLQKLVKIQIVVADDEFNVHVRQLRLNIGRIVFVQAGAPRIHLNSLSVFLLLCSFRIFFAASGEQG